MCVLCPQLLAEDSVHTTGTLPCPQLLCRAVELVCQGHVFSPRSVPQPLLAPEVLEFMCAPVWAASSPQLQVQEYLILNFLKMFLNLLCSASTGTGDYDLFGPVRRSWMSHLASPHLGGVTTATVFRNLCFINNKFAFQSEEFGTSLMS